MIAENLSFAARFKKELKNLTVIKKAPVPTNPPEITYSLNGTFKYARMQDNHAAYVEPQPAQFEEIKKLVCTGILSILQLQKPPSHENAFKKLKAMALSGLILVISPYNTLPSQETVQGLVISPLFTFHEDSGRVDVVFLVVLGGVDHERKLE